MPDLPSAEELLQQAADALTDAEASIATRVRHDRKEVEFRSAAEIAERVALGNALREGQQYRVVCNVKDPGL